MTKTKKNRISDILWFDASTNTWFRSGNPVDNKSEIKKAMKEVGLNLSLFDFEKQVIESGIERFGIF